MKRRLSLVLQVLAFTLVLFLPAGVASAAGPFLSDSPVTWASGFLPNDPTLSTKTAIGDVNGDGKKDAGTWRGGTWYVALSTGTSFAPYSAWAPPIPGVPNIAASVDPLLGDVTGDGKADAVTVYNGNWYVAVSTGFGFAAPTVWISGLGAPNGTKVQNFLADVDGNVMNGRKADAISTDQSTWKVAISSGTGFGTATTRAVMTTSNTKTYSAVGDVNGDRGADFIQSRYKGEWWVSRSTTTGTYTAPEYWGESNGTFDSLSYKRIHVGDIDGDGKDDAISRYGGSWTVMRSSGTGFISQFEWFSSFLASDTDAFAADVNGDKKADAVSMSQGVWTVASRISVPDQIKLNSTDWTNILDENFDGTILSPSRWNTLRYDYWFTGAAKGTPIAKAYNSLEEDPVGTPNGYTSTYTPANNTVSGGSLKQKLGRISGTNQYTIGSINSLGQIDGNGNYVPDTGTRFKEGYVEAKIQVNGCEGCWPAFWMLPAVPEGVSWPVPSTGYCGYPSEVDIFEFFPFGAVDDGRAYFNTHWGSYDCRVPAPPAQLPPCTNCHDLWSDAPSMSKTVINSSLADDARSHTYGMLWTGGASPYIQMFVDGIAGPKIMQGVPTEKMYLILTLQHAAGFEVEKLNRAVMTTDSIKVWQ